MDKIKKNTETSFIKDANDPKGKIYIIEGKEQPNNVFIITRFICEIVPQETLRETHIVADMILKSLKSSKK